MNQNCVYYGGLASGDNNFRIFRGLITESQSNFERSETVKRFTEVSLRRRQAELCGAQGAKDGRLVEVCFSPSLLIKWIYFRSKGG